MPTNKNLTPTRAHTDLETKTREVIEGTQLRILELKAELAHHQQFISSAQKICEHDWRGQDDVHPHGTPRETFICTICLKEEVR